MMSKNLHQITGLNLSKLRALCVGTVGADPKCGDANLLFWPFSPKPDEIEKNWTERGRTSLAPPRSATVLGMHFESQIIFPLLFVEIDGKQHILLTFKVVYRLP